MINLKDMALETIENHIREELKIDLNKIKVEFYDYSYEVDDAVEFGFYYKKEGYVVVCNENLEII